MRNVDLQALTPEAIVRELDRYIVGQTAAKRAVAVALRNRYRRQRVAEDVRDEITPKNILLIGPTGVGKTEVARRLAKLADAPFIKVEATKFTEVGYVGRDVESIVRDLVENAVAMEQEERMESIRAQAEERATERLVSVLVQALDEGKEAAEEGVASARGSRTRPDRAVQRRRKTVVKMLTDRKLEEQIVEIEVENDDGVASAMDVFSGMSSDDMNEAVQDFLLNLQLSRKRQRKVSVREARQILTHEEANRLVDWDQIVDTAIERVEQGGVVFLDEIDKIVGKGSESGPDVSGEGVQRDLLPIVEGSTVQTRYGPVKTDHILFIGAGAFSRSKPSDLIPELQGRFPLRVELETLEKEDLVRILSQPDNALTKQYALLMAVEDVVLTFTEDGIDEIATIATALNERTENIGARRLHTVIEQTLEDVSFNATSYAGQTIVVDRQFVQSTVGPLAAHDEISTYIL